jgi:hypothetical protein
MGDGVRVDDLDAVSLERARHGRLPAADAAGEADREATCHSSSVAR